MRRLMLIYKFNKTDAKFKGVFLTEKKRAEPCGFALMKFFLLED